MGLRSNLGRVRLRHHARSLSGLRAVRFDGLHDRSECPCASCVAWLEREWLRTTRAYARVVVRQASIVKIDVHCTVTYSPHAPRLPE